MSIVVCSFSWFCVEIATMFPAFGELFSCVSLDTAFLQRLRPGVDLFLKWTAATSVYCLYTVVCFTCCSSQLLVCLVALEEAVCTSLNAVGYTLSKATTEECWKEVNEASHHRRTRFCAIRYHHGLELVHRIRERGVYENTALLR